MGFFSTITDTAKKAEAGVLVQNLLEHQANAGLFHLDPKKIAHKLVSKVWDAKPDVYFGKFAQRPHKITVAASALINGYEWYSSDDPNRPALLIALGNLLSELEVNGQLYSLNSLDHEILSEVVDLYKRRSVQLQARHVSVAKKGLNANQMKTGDLELQNDAVKVIQALLKNRARENSTDIELEAIAKLLVAKVREKNSTLFTDPTLKKPLKTSIAAAALAWGIADEEIFLNSNSCGLSGFKLWTALGRVLEVLEALRPEGDSDKDLIRFAAQTYLLKTKSE